MTLPEGRKPILWRDLEFAEARGHPSTFEAECKQLRAHISAALDCLNMSRFSNAEHERAKEWLTQALGSAHSAGKGQP